MVTSDEEHRTQTRSDERPCVPMALDDSQVIEGRPRSSVALRGWSFLRQNRSQRPAVAEPSMATDGTDDNERGPLSHGK